MTTRCLIPLPGSAFNASYNVGPAGTFEPSFGLYPPATIPNPSKYSLKPSCANPSAGSLVIGFGTFGSLLYLMNTKLKNLYIPKYACDVLIKGTEWGENINVHIIDIPDYIKVGDWKNTQQQRDFMLSYIY